ncbi:hypothetical protein J2Z32_003456 [Paenibacillus turicensis]|uniref:Uncharacterized protein n=1 Tax=Paenibacillus turicensis TaxID=160487 RepID=A0ABS4FW57_9BACL|nr:hypothetical protein [Paenibacillus turicensis]
MRQRIINISFIVVCVCFGAITLALTLDWATKYYLYLSQRDALYSLIKSGVSDIETYKRTVSYLQGTATRQINNIKGVGIVFGLVLASFCLYRKLERIDKHGKSKLN